MLMRQYSNPLEINRLSLRQSMSMHWSLVVKEPLLLVIKTKDSAYKLVEATRTSHLDNLEAA